MFNSLRGIISFKGESQLFLLAGGIEWDISVSATTRALLPEPGNEARVFIFFYHKEDQMKLFGFATEEERSVFLDLMKVDGIGPRQAIKILSGINVESFLATVDSEDVDALIRIPGLGKKTAQKIILALRGKLTLKTDRPEAGEHNELLDGLVEMGFDKRQALKALEDAAKELEETSKEALKGPEREKELFRRAIVRLSS